MQILFILSLIFAVLVSIFAIMNSNPVTVKLLWKQYQFSQAIIILGSAAIGAIIVAFLGLFSKIKSSFKIRELQNKIKLLEKNLEELKNSDDESNMNNIIEGIDKPLNELDNINEVDKEKANE